MSNTPCRKLESDSISSKTSSIDRARKCYRRAKFTWLWEVLALIGSMLCQCAIVAILASMQGKDFRQWTSSVSINTVVSTLMTAAKSLMLYSVAACIGQLKWIYFKSKPRQLYHLELLEQIGRGPIGAAQSLFRIRWPAAYLSMAIVLLALAMDPSAQEVVRYELTDSQELDSSASFMVTHNYTANASLGKHAYLNGIILFLEALYGVITCQETTSPCQERY